MNELTTRTTVKEAKAPTFFDYSGHRVRTTVHGGGVWFVLSDVARVLGHKDAGRLARLLDDDEKGVDILQTLGGPQRLLVVNESGLYAVAFRSRKAEARAFRRWVTGTVLPSIRKTGGYFSGQEALDREDVTAAEVLSYLAELEEHVSRFKAAELLKFAQRQERIEHMAEERDARRRGLGVLKGRTGTGKKRTAPARAPTSGRHVRVMKATR